MTFCKFVTLYLLGPFNNHVYVPLMRWSARDLESASSPQLESAVQQGEYIDASPTINLAVVLAARNDTLLASTYEPVKFQADLNACMETCRMDQIKQPMMMMFAHIVGRGAPPDEAIVRVVSNFLLLGMYLERRIKGGGFSHGLKDKPGVWIACACGRTDTIYDKFDPTEAELWAHYLTLGWTGTPEDCKCPECRDTPPESAA